MHGPTGGLIVPACSSVGGSKSGGDYAPGQILGFGVTPNGGYDAQGHARADFGTLGVSTLASTTDGYTYRRIDSHAQASWMDTISVNSDTLARGSHVVVRITEIATIASLFATQTDGFYQTSRPGSTLQFDGAGREVGCAGVDLYGDQGCTAGQIMLHVGQNTLTHDLNLIVGNDQAVGATLSAASTYYDPYDPYEPPIADTAAGGTGVNALGTVHTYFTVLTTGATLSFQSGASYALSAAPEPRNLGADAARLRRTRRRLTPQTAGETRALRRLASILPSLSRSGESRLARFGARRGGGMVRRL